MMLRFQTLTITSTSWSSRSPSTIRTLTPLQSRHCTSWPRVPSMSKRDLGRSSIIHSQKASRTRYRFPHCGHSKRGMPSSCSQISQAAAMQIVQAANAGSDPQDDVETPRNAVRDVRRGENAAQKTTHFDNFARIFLISAALKARYVEWQ